MLTANTPPLSTHDVYGIQEMAKEKRRQFDIGMGPLGDNIFLLTRKAGIHLIFLPIPMAEESPFTGLYLSSQETTERLFYIGLNTADYYDKQIFTLAHELYHHWTEERTNKEGVCICRQQDQEIDTTLEELKANRFAAEFLLPTDILEKEIKEKNEGQLALKQWKYNALLRFIARLHGDYHLPYKAIVRRLYEIHAITDEQLELLWNEPARFKESAYYKLGILHHADMFRKLNTITHEFGVDGENIDQVLRVFEDEQVSLEELAEDLYVFNKNLSDVNLQPEVDPHDLEEWNDLLSDLEDGEEDEGES
jgi:Zn-dependent peptidase ImmA (M78 family)